MPNPTSIGSGLQVWATGNNNAYSDLGTTPATNGVTVEQWNDQNGVRNFVQATGGNRPTYETSAVNGFNTLRLAAASKMIASGPTNFGNVFTFFCTFKPSAFNGGLLQVTDGNFLHGFQFWTLASPNTMAVLVGNDGNSTHQFNSLTLTAGTLYSAIIVGDGTNATLYLCPQGGTEVTQTVTCGSTIVNTTTEIALGDILFSASQLGDILDIGIYNTALSGSNLTNLKTWTRAFFALTATPATVYAYSAITSPTMTIGAGAFNGSQTITITSSVAGDTITPSVGSPGTGAVTVTPTNGAASFTFTVTTNGTAGNRTLTITNGQSWVNPSAITLNLVTATGEVELSGTTLGTAPFSGSFSLAFLLTEDFTQAYAANVASGGWAGLDFGTGANVTLTRYRFAPAIDDSTTERTTLCVGGTVQGGTDAAFANTPTTIATVPAMNPVQPPRQYTEISLSGVYRYVRFVGPTGAFCNFSKFRFIGTGTGNARPVAPLISPWGGRYPGGSSTVAFSSLTTSASFYYTTDGTTPTNTNGTLYAGTFSLSIPAGTTVTLKVVAYESSLSTPLSEIRTAIFKTKAFVPRDDWYDTAGNSAGGVLIEAHAGQISGPFGGRYYYCGDFNNGGNKTTGSSGDLWAYYCVTVYSSTDLYNWRLDTQIAMPSTYIFATRPHILYNLSANNYVLWTLTLDAAGDRQYSIYTATVPSGPWTNVNNIAAPDGHANPGDFSLLKDDGGIAYIAYNCPLALTNYFSKLNSTYTDMGGSFILSPVQSREGLSLFKRGSTYFWVHGKLNYYDSTSTYDVKYAVSTSATPLGTWNNVGALYASDPVGGNYNGQVASVYKVPGKIDGYILLTDYWSNIALYTSRQVWLPITFPTATTMAVTTPASWDLSTFANAPSSSVSSLRGRRLPVSDGYGGKRLRGRRLP
jgi:hypothetical protein